LHSHFQVLACYKAPQISPAIFYSSNPHLLHGSRKSHEHLQRRFTSEGCEDHRKSMMIVGNYIMIKLTMTHITVCTWVTLPVSLFELFGVLTTSFETVQP
jgi:hypothetical protein